MTGRIDIGPLAEDASAALIQHDNGTWGLAVEGAGAASADQEQPVRIEREGGATCAAGYGHAERDDDGVTARAAVTCDDGARFRVEDRWRTDGGVLVVERHLTVEAGGDAGFGSALGLRLRAPVTWPDVRPFVPGMLYGDPAHLPDDAIGSPAWWRRGVREVRIREDRLPAPLVALGLGGGASLALLHADPDGATTEADALSLGGETLTDGRFRFGALGVAEADGRLELGFWFPGTEGEVTYRGDTYPGGQERAWRRRYHPTEAGSEQRYQLRLRVGQDEPFPDLVRGAWRWAWDHFAPSAQPRDLEADRQSLTAVLADVAVETDDGRAGFPSVLDATTGAPPPREGLLTLARDVLGAPPEMLALLEHVERPGHLAYMGFTGRSATAARWLLRAAETADAETAARYRETGARVLDSFAGLPAAPPQAEGFHLDLGVPAVHLITRLSLRALCEGGATLLAAWEREGDRAHDGWRQWPETFGRWLVGEQRADGSFPRIWPVGEGTEPAEPAGTEAVPLLVALARVTGDGRFLGAARLAGDWAWAHGQSEGAFYGATIDNPNALDKESGLYALHAYTALFEATGDAQWLDRARVAADAAESWTYLWNVPTPVDADPDALHWSPGASTVGLQLIATGHSLVDAAVPGFFVGPLLRLAEHAGDSHYREVAQLWLHGTKAMLARDDRTLGLAGPGWQQEHWSLAPMRGRGLHRWWLPWVPCAHLAGIYGAQDADLAPPPSA